LFVGVLSVLTLSSHAFAEAPSGRYTYPANGTVYDTRTKLTWQREAEETEYTQSDAASYCTSLSLAGGGWRLPSVDELLTLIDPTEYNPAVDPTAFPNARSGSCWSSTPYVGMAGHMWIVYFLEGFANRSSVSIKWYARCVR